MFAYEITRTMAMERQATLLAETRASRLARLARKARRRNRRRTSVTSDLVSLIKPNGRAPGVGPPVPSAR